MNSFFDYIFTHWYVGVLIVVLIAATVVMWIKAISASQKSRELREAEIARLEKEKALRNEFRILDEEKFESVENEKLLFGVAVNIQMYLEKEQDMKKVFEEMPEEKKYVYALNYVFEDGKDNALSEFFRANGQPLTGEAAKAVKSVVGGDFSDIFMSLYNMIDDDVEDASYDVEKISECDKKYSEIMASKKEEIFKSIADYIKSNKQIYMN